MFDRFTTPEDLFSYKLGLALSMERDILANLAVLQEAAQREELKTLLAEHAVETQQQIENLEAAFGLLGEEVQAHECLVTKAMAKEVTGTLRKTDASLADAVVLSAALETEHHEAAVYEFLITNADARGAQGVKALLEANLAQEDVARERITTMARRIAHEGVAVPVEGTSGGVKAAVAAGVAVAAGAAAVIGSRVAGSSESGGHAAEAEAGVPIAHAGGAAAAPASGTVVTPPADTTVTTDDGLVVAEELNDDALQERIVESEARENAEH
ncbi:ferritin-like domain-containing protein [Kineococcus glutinatus]|uniref:Ferritin-like metal-binding protein YciE n=1 Tax=Kineococcus glutinatus TaxID=1070872 RepID=A0ABP9H4F4_9ACTN